MRVRHVVLFDLDRGVDAMDPRVAAACLAEERLSVKVPGDHGWTFGRDVSRRPVSADFAGSGDFASQSDLASFLAHPAHQEAAALWAPLATWRVADFEVGR